MKPLLVIPMAGLGSRFRRQGYTVPKQLLEVAPGESALQASLDSIALQDFEVRFVARKEQLETEGLNAAIDALMKKKGGDYSVVALEAQTRGSVETVLAAIRDDEGDRPLHIYTLDIAFEPVYSGATFKSVGDEPVHGGILVFQSNSPAYSYVQTSPEGYATRTAEKEVISHDAAVGIYYFSSTELFSVAAREMFATGDTTLGEYYIAPLYNRLISNERRVLTQKVDKMFLFGTPEEYVFYRDFAYPTRKLNKAVAISSDHSGYKLKERIFQALTSMGIQVLDNGTFSEEPTNYDQFVSRSINALEAGEVDLIISSCMSGQGVNIFGNAHSSVLGTLVYSVDSARLAVEHNSSNFFSFPQDIWLERDPSDLSAALAIILSSSFDGGRHQLRMMRTSAVKRGSS